MKVLMTGDTITAPNTEMHKTKVETVGATTAFDSVPKKMADIRHVNYPRKHIDLSWLSSAAKVYNISPNIQDYIVTPVPIVTAMYPNRNTQAFEADDLFSFDPKLGRMLYQTFKGAPTHIDHKNQINENAKGVNLDVTVMPVKKYKTFKVITLAAFDRNKDPALVEDILTNKRKGYSMGALASSFVCSICEGILGPGIKRTCTCHGTDFTDLRTLGSVINGKLHYHIAKNFRYIEVSSVLSPADVEANSSIRI